MKLVRAFAVGSFLALASLACSGMPTSIPMPTAELTAPWKGMDLPIGAGNVLMSDESMLSVQYSGDKVKKLKGGYVKAIKGSGFKQLADGSSNGNVAVTFQNKKKKTMALGITSGAGNTLVALTVN